MKIGYKVTDSENYSVSKILRKNPGRESIIKYKLNKWICPNPGMGALAVFKNKKRALKFKNYFKRYNFKVFECLYVPSKSTCLWDGIKKLYRSAIISRSVLADEVYLLNEIYP